MATRNLTISPGEFYHIYNRGVDKRIVFETPNDYERFIDLLFVSNSTKPISYRNLKSSKKGLYNFDREETLVSIGAYCVMPNHFHLLITPNSKGSAAKFMNKLTTAYTMYFNKKNDRTGALFQGTYKAKHATSDEYLKYLFSYIHLNPRKLIDQKVVNKKEILNNLKSYPYSSLASYFNQTREEEPLLNKNVFPQYFLDAQNLEEELFDWITYPEI